MDPVVVTGLGVVSSLGRDTRSFREALLAGKSGISEITAFDTDSCRSHRAAKLRDFDPGEYIDPDKLRRIDEVGWLAIASGKLALADAGIAPNSDETSDVGVVLGTFTAGLHSTVEFLGRLVRGGPRDASPMLFSNTVGNAPASLCALEFGLRGANVTVTNKEASSLAAIGYSVNLLRRGLAAAVLTGGVDDIEANFFRIHDRFKVMSPTDGQEEAARPFDRRRNGFLLGEGGYTLLAESRSHAERRGARIYAEILGVAGTSSRCGINQWPREPRDLTRSMALALEEADCAPDAIDAVFASANGTIDLDATEAAAIENLFGTAAVNVVSIKGAVGESGATGAASLAAAILCMREGRLPPTVGLVTLDPNCPVDARSVARRARGTRALVNSFASGGSNYSVVVTVAT